MKHCCEWMRAMSDRDGKEGFSIQLKDDGSVQMYLLNFSSYGADKSKMYEESFKKFPEFPKLSLGGDISINYCPSCGFDLRHSLAETEIQRFGLWWVIRKQFGW